MRLKRPEYFFIILSVSVFLFACENDDSLTNMNTDISDIDTTVTDTGDVNNTIISISGQISPYPGTSINKVGLFNYHWDVRLQEDNTAPFAAAPITDSTWVLDIPDITQDSSLNGAVPEAFSGGKPIYKFLLLGWTDIDGDGRFDPNAGETTSLSHTGSDTFNIAYLYYVDSDDSPLINNWWAGSDTLKNNNSNWLVKDVSASSPISQWTYRNENYSAISSIARRGGYNNESGYTIWLASSDLSCSSPSVPKPRMKFRYPELSTRTYYEGEIFINIFSQQSNTDGNTGFSGITRVDTTHDFRIEGWVVLERTGGFSEDDTSRIYGTFSVPYCP